MNYVRYFNEPMKLSCLVRAVIPVRIRMRKCFSMFYLANEDLKIKKFITIEIGHKARLLLLLLLPLFFDNNNAIIVGGGHPFTSYKLAVKLQF